MKTAIQIVCGAAGLGGIMLGMALAQEYERKIKATPQRQSSYAIVILLVFAPAVLAYWLAFQLLMFLG